MKDKCELCERDMKTTSHHLIPVSNHKNKWFKKNFTKEEMNLRLDLCGDCHPAVHNFISEKELGKKYNTKEKLLEHPEVLKFVNWVKTKIGKQSKISK
jgi:ribosomal protein L31